MLYADYNATAPILPSVFEAMVPFLREEFGNPSSLQNPLGRRARIAVESARGSVAALLGVEADEVIFLSGGTESCFHALLGAYDGNRTHILASAFEHPAVLETIRYLSGPPFLAEAELVSGDRSGSIGAAAFTKRIRKETGIVSCMLANNETGVIFPVKEIAAASRAAGALSHTDATQAVGKIRVSMKDTNADLLSFSGHKLGAPKGIGVLLVRRDCAWKPVVRGGGQESGRRGGTESVPLIAALGEAARLAEVDLENGAEPRLGMIRDLFESTLREIVPQAVFNGSGVTRLPNTSSVTIPGALAADLVDELGDEGIFISTGSACKSKNPEPSHVYTAMGLSTGEALSTLRVSFGRDSTEDTAATVATAIAAAARKARSARNDELERLLS